MESHKPNREDERARIEALGGTIMHWGTWRVNGQLAVARAIGRDLAEDDASIDLRELQCFVCQVMASINPTYRRSQT